ncbi:MAG: oxidoreductase [Novosphingobium sp. 28-62-57]|uniref:SDR family NAD(P)-dependent oxidoreductase n=1 Tax=unclassified Novosphingobium TaxID=2644732 RepID=UPI000BC8049B|nr:MULTISPECIES: SDR family NAD(P)-dependent oxidoreductase [unclassified Novosphingobium]OYW51421.1 MAG: oxidoreductase [Novosphingobium sp. 12-62-10]OYZ10442.1 MAG: oxidoreductase [Novosphingobium sp. 28-62-57]OZA40678.1 MAG: oxidoreductase [Novosphingobium sp. 17-62-9]HQS69868.1 SDR family NAD(P)-dependent oxidoreductase [Novosphingobium sp.]
MQGRLHERAVIVVGAGTGIGAATVERLCAEGARVCVADVNLPAAQGVAARMTDAGHEAHALGVDITDEAAVNACFADAVALLGGLDGAHINAADLRTIFLDSDALALDLATFDRTIDVNLRGHLLCTRAALPHLLKSPHGAIVYTSSGASIAGEPERPSYAASKSGLNALMRHVASKWGKAGLTANCVAPGFVMTPEMIAGGAVPPDFIDQCIAATRSTRLGTAEDIAAMVAMLLSDDGRWINGQVIHVNGGALLT